MPQQNSTFQPEEAAERSPYAFQGTPVTSPDPEAKEPVQFGDLPGLLIALIAAQVILVAVIFCICKAIKKHTKSKEKP